LGNPAEFTIHELAEKVIELTGSSSELKFLSLPSDDPHQRQPDLSKTTEEIEWFPNTTLNDGLVNTVIYFEELLKDGIEAETWAPL